MKRIVINSLAAIGAIGILFGTLKIAASLIFPGYREVASKEFGTPEAIESISILYSRIESAPSDPALKVVRESLMKYPRIRRIPISWLPKNFASKWGAPDGDDLVLWRNVFAYYDEAGSLVGIEFLGSRYGCFASRDATRCPSWYQSLYRIAERPIYITIRVTGE